MALGAIRSVGRQMPMFLCEDSFEFGGCRAVMAARGGHHTMGICLYGHAQMVGLNTR